MAKRRKQLSPTERATFAGRFSLHLQSLLDERGWTTYDLARRLKMGEPAVRKWLRAQSTPPLRLLEVLAAALHTNQHPIKDYRHVLPAGVRVKDAAASEEWQSREVLRRRAEKTIADAERVAQTQSPARARPKAGGRKA